MARSPRKDTIVESIWRNTKAICPICKTPITNWYCPECGVSKNNSGYIIYENDDECVITKKGQEAKGYVSTYKSIEKIALEIIENPELYSRESISVTRDMS